MLGGWLDTREVRSLRNSELCGGSTVSLEPSSVPDMQSIYGWTELDGATEASMKRGFPGEFK